MNSVGKSASGARGSGWKDGPADPRAVLERLDTIEVTARETLAVVRGILAVVAAEPDEGRPRLDELLAEIVALQRDTLRVAGENAVALRRLSAALLPPAAAGPGGPAPNGYAVVPTGHGAP